jgi:GNAT superfamily N-acetyltransferase
MPEIKDDLPSLKMWRPNGDITIPPLPEGFKIRRLDWKTEGACWCSCFIKDDMGVCETTQELFEDKMAHDASVPPNSIFVVADENDIPVATATAQIKEAAGLPYLHMVAVRPDMTGRGLGFAVNAAVIEEHRRNGRNGCWLVTQDWRKAAVKLYVKLGFRAVMIHDSLPERWKSLAEELKMPVVKCVDGDTNPLPDITST